MTPPLFAPISNCGSVFAWYRDIKLCKDIFAAMQRVVQKLKDPQNHLQQYCGCHCDSRS
jgi:hypothetical protein